MMYIVDLFAIHYSILGFSYCNELRHTRKPAQHTSAISYF